MKFILIALMAISGLRAIMAGAAVVGGLISHGRFDGDDVTYLIDAGVIFWLASETYSLHTRQTYARFEIQWLTAALCAHQRVGKSDKNQDET